MKVVCRDKDRYLKSLTEGKVYEVISTSPLSYKIKGNTGNEYWFPKSLFADVVEQKEQKPSLTGLKIGDTVKVLRAGDRDKDAFYQDMERFIGKEFKILKFGFDDSKYSHLIELSTADDWDSYNYWFDGDTLEIVKRKENNMNYTQDYASKQMVKERRWIVGSIDSAGLFSISGTPVGHTTQLSAKTEAKRLANQNNTKTFVVMQLQAGYKVATVEEI